MSRTDAPSGVFLAIEGEPVPIEDVDWLLVSRCGCVAGVTVANCHGQQITNAAQARDEFGENAVERKRNDEDGFTYRPIRHADFKAEVGTMTCDHDPRFGVAKVDVPEGMGWATTDSHFGRKTHLRHIVPDEAISSREKWVYGEEPVKSLCGKANRVWNEDEWHDCVTCRKCEKAVTA